MQEMKLANGNTFVAVLGFALIIGQAAILILAIKFVRNLGAFTARLEQIHVGNLAIEDRQQKLLDHIEINYDKDAA